MGTATPLVTRPFRHLTYHRRDFDERTRPTVSLLAGGCPTLWQSHTLNRDTTVLLVDSLHTPVGIECAEPTLTAAGLLFIQGVSSPCRVVPRYQI